MLGDCLPPLHGVRVLDFTQVIAGPYCSMLLADGGADVVKVERPEGGDDMRTIGRYAGRRSEDEDYFYTVNRRKRSIVVDLKSNTGRALAQSLATRADVVVQNMAPETAERLGIGYSELRAANPGIIYCAISGFGQTGPYRDRVALDPIIQAMSGVMSVTGEPHGPPIAVGAPIADVVSGMFAAYAISLAIVSKRECGRGTLIDLSMLEAMMAILGPRMGEALQGGRSPLRVGNENPMRVPGGTFLASDGQYISFIVMNDSFWAPFCDVIGHPEWIHESRFATADARVRQRRELNETIAIIIGQEPASHWMTVFLNARIPCSEVLDYVGALSQPQVVSRGLVQEVDHPRSGPIRLVGQPWKTDLPLPPLLPPPLLGEHSAEILREWLGWDESQVTSYCDELASAGADSRTDGPRESRSPSTPAGNSAL